MTDEQAVAPEGATEEAVASQEASEATENTEGQTEGQPAEGEGEAPEKPEEKTEAQKRRERRKAQMQRLHEEAQEAERKVKEQEARLEKAKEAAQSNTPPKEADFQDYNEYLIAMGAYHAARNMDTRATKEIEEAAQAEQERVKQLKERQKAELAQSWADQVEDAKTRYADFEKVVYTAPISDSVAEMVAGSDIGADLAYYLGMHRDYAAALSRAHPIEAAREIGRLEARLSLPKPNLQTQAPDPVNPVKPKPTGQRDPKKMSFDEYREARMSGKLR